MLSNQDKAVTSDIILLHVSAENKRLKDIINEVNAWAVCAVLASPEDMVQNLPRIVDITTLEGDQL